MLPFETPSIFDQLPRFVFKMPRVVHDQKAKFESDELFRRLSRECEVAFVRLRENIGELMSGEHLSGYQQKHEVREELAAFVATGTNLQLVFSPCHNGYVDCCDFDKEHGKVHIKSSFIMNGVCVRYRGWIDLDRLDGVGCLEYDEERGRLEDAVLRDQIECYNQRLRDFEEKQRAFRARHERQAEAELEARRKHQELSPDRGGSVSN
ncbi:unnamed protein product [Ixodes hexagonus]